MKLWTIAIVAVGIGVVWYVVKPSLASASSSSGAKGTGAINPFTGQPMGGNVSGTNLPIPSQPAKSSPGYDLAAQPGTEVHPWGENVVESVKSWWQQVTGPSS